MRYKLIPHTADIGISLTNKTLKGLFEDGAFALFDILCDINKVKPRFRHTISVTAGNYEELLNEFLSRLLREFTVENNLLNKVEIKKIEQKEGEFCLSGVIYGEPYDAKKHRIKTEIKAVTFHNLFIKKVRAAYKAEVILDV